VTQDSQQSTNPEQALLDVLPLLELSGVQFMELSGRRRDYEPEGDTPESMEDLEEKDVTAMGVQVHQDDESVIVRVQGGVHTDSVRVNVTTAARFTKSEPVVLDAPTIGIFVEKVAIMAIYPFIRQAVHDMSSRLGAPATLHLLRAGQVSLTDDDDELDQAEAHD
jgi:hypothetical protein